MPLEPKPTSSASHHPVVTSAARRLFGRDPLTPEARKAREIPSARDPEIWRWLDLRERLFGGGDRGMARHNLSIFTCGLIPPERLKIESDLMRMKWFDYRFMHPAAATALFALHYEQEFRWAWRKHVDVETVDRKQPLGFKDLFTLNTQGFSPSMRGDVSALWQARQVADAIGVPYGFYMYEAFERLMRRGWKRLPRPNQLSDDKGMQKLAEAVEKSWLERADAVAWERYATDPRYRNEFYRGEFTQDDHHDWVLRIDRRRLFSPGHIADLCFQKQLLTTGLIRARVGERVSEAISEASSYGFVSNPMPEGVITDTRPGCHGVPHAYQGDSEACRRCQHQKTCVALAAETLNTIETTLGDRDPVALREREQARERQRRRWARLKGAGGREL